MRLRRSVACAALAVAVAAAVAPAAAQAPAVLDVTAMDYAFKVSPSVKAGLVTVRLRNTGKKLHHVQLFKLSEGKRVSDLFVLFLAAKSIAEPPPWAVPAGGPSAAMPGQVIEIQQALSPGRYALICWVPVGDGTLHFMRGMIGEVEVTGPASRVTEPKADLVALTTEHTITLDRAVTRGRKVIRIENRGTVPHEFLLVRLKPGESARDVAEWSGAGQLGTPPHESWS
ncbi:MAG: hypothetical protein SFW08_11950, partial [Gemmatimonadaceae bacterium]|nr:hypothetical protein [Gemmatimonadaceae bacterium]